MNGEMLKALRARAVDVRKDVVRMVGMAKSGHLASSLSLVDLLVYLYERELRLRAAEPQWPERDRFILSKRNGAPALYTVLAHGGFFPREELWNFRSLGAILQHRPEWRRTPGIDGPSGSPGLGLGLAGGLALGLVKKGCASRVFCLLGDSELETGTVWASIAMASRFALANLVALVDCNVAEGERLQTRAGERAFQAFGWTVAHVDGHSFADMEEVFGGLSAERSGPAALFVRTCLGKGVTFFEEGRWPRSTVAPGRDDVDRALGELNGLDGAEDGR
ncbi:MULTISPECIES: transketolase [Synergistales]|nr:transketolase [Aminithiophilus ramosus]